MNPKTQSDKVINNMHAKNHTVEKYFLVKICQIWVVFDATTYSGKKRVDFCENY